MMDGSAGSGCALRLDPFTLPVRFSAQDRGADGQTRQIEIDRERVVVRREVRGIPMKVGVPVSAFRGISLQLLDAAGAAAVAVTLAHRDEALSVPLLISLDCDDVVALWKSWGRVLGLPLLVIDGDGTMREPYPRLGDVTVGTPTPRRRRRAAVKWRRPLQLMRRKPGRLPANPIVHSGEREIIARN